MQRNVEKSLYLECVQLHTGKVCCEPQEGAAVAVWLAACCFTVHSGVEGVRAEACISPR